MTEEQTNVEAPEAVAEETVEAPEAVEAVEVAENAEAPESEPVHVEGFKPITPMKKKSRVIVTVVVVAVVLIITYLVDRHLANMVMGFGG